MVHRVERELAGRPLIFETGELARQASGSLTVRYGDTVVLATATVAPQPREGVDFLPLTVDFEERMYAAGKIPGSFFRREGRPSTDAVLAGRLADRSLRPLFPKGFRNEIQIILTVLSTDQENLPDVLGIVGASAAVTLSPVPFAGPLSGVRVGYVDGEIVINPTFSQIQRSSLDLVVAGTKDAVVMVEAGAQEVGEALLLEAVRRGQEANRLIVEMQEELRTRVGVPLSSFTSLPTTHEATEALRGIVGDRLSAAVRGLGKEERSEASDTLLEEALVRLGEIYEPARVRAAFDEMLRQEVRNAILRRGERPDGRSPTQIRPITCRVGVLPRVHGSALFNRGETQVLTVTTLGPLAAAQKLDTLSPEESKRFLHHYNMPPYSVGEVRRMGGPGRREIGHGALAERALEPVIPGEVEFPYTLRLVSDVLGSNGSTSMASVCASSLSLMDAGVPIKAPVAGIAMGLVMGVGGEFAVLTDIQGIEDALGDMDFKVAGTAAGVTGLQMDIKVTGITDRVLERALAQARDARLLILDKMREALAEARPELSRYAPRMTRIQINRERIGALIGPGGKMIRSIVEETKATVDVEDDGTVYVGSTSAEATERAIAMIRRLTQDITVGQVFTGKVVRTTGFGAFVELAPGRDGMVHISELADYRVPDVEDVVKVGDEITVLVTDIDPTGRIRLSRRALLVREKGAGDGAEGGDGTSAEPSPSRSPVPEHGRGPGPGGEGFRRAGPPLERRGPGGPGREGFRRGPGPERRLGPGGPPAGGRPGVPPRPQP
ncbi:MAG: polyribonucleotide nucleotidyltransferase [Chloroflexi bacterium]|nr:polyribonucleotide nucleotidyltransferase [Chloroflexota bacterium]